MFEMENLSVKECVEAGIKRGIVAKCVLAQRGRYKGKKQDVQVIFLDEHE
jgi:hypothetical protein